MRNHALLSLATALPILVAACASTSQGDGAPRPQTNVLTREEIQAAGVRNAYEAVDRLRPRWLIVRSGPRSFGTETEVVVFQDRMYLGTPEVLERIGIDGIYEMRYLDGATAKASLPGLGSRHVQGAIVISMTPPEQRDR